jgi:hypothetical protein
MNRCVHKNYCDKNHRPSKRKLYEEPASKRQRSRRVSSRKIGLAGTAPDASTWLRPGMPVGATSSTNNSSESADPLLTQSPHERTEIPIWVQIPIWVTHYVRGRRIEELWVEGKPQDRTLSAFISGLSDLTQVADIKRIRLELATPTGDTRLTVTNGDEDDWVSVDKTFSKKARGKESADMKISVELLCETSRILDDIETVEEEEFEF